MSANAGNYIELPQYIHNVCDREDLCDYLYKTTEEKNCENNWLKSRAALTTNIISLQNITEKAGTKLSGEAVIYPNANTLKSDENRKDVF